MNHISPEKMIERQLCARIQHFYDMLCERRNRLVILAPSQSKIDEELTLIIDQFEKIFEDIVYTDD